MTKKVLKTTVEPHALTRRDRPTLRWSVEEVPAKRGVARTDISGRRIFAPAGLTEIERIVRAHELMHARITPAESIEDWIKRGVASWDALQSVEEVRVNYALHKAGFDLNELTDGNEDADGELAVIQEDWRSAVLFAVGSAGTAGGKRFLVGVRRQSKKWANALQKIQKHIWNMAEGAETGRIGRQRVQVMPIFSTELHRGLKLAPAGFAWTEKWAEYVDRISAMTPPTTQDDTKSGKKKSKDGDEGSEDTKSETKSDSQEITNRASEEEDFEKRMRNIKPIHYSSQSADWSKLVFGKTILSAVSKGSLGKKSTAQAYGRNPRRIGRLYTDPQRRVFDHERRSKGGIVLIDGSGSMSLTREDVIKILRVAPGATVAIYSDMDEGRGKPNIHILAKNGKCVEEKNMPEFGKGNGVDFPALEWAVDQRKGKEPIVWVTDGGVCAGSDGFSHVLAMQCIKTAKRENVLCVDHVDDAVKALKSLNNGQSVRVKYPQYFRQILKEVGGMETSQTVAKR